MLWLFYVEANDRGKRSGSWVSESMQDARQVAARAGDRWERMTGADVRAVERNR